MTTYVEFLIPSGLKERQVENRDIQPLVLLDNAYSFSFYEKDENGEPVNRSQIYALADRVMTEEDLKKEITDLNFLAEILRAMFDRSASHIIRMADGKYQVPRGSKDLLYIDGKKEVIWPPEEVERVRQERAALAAAKKLQEERIAYLRKIAPKPVFGKKGM